MTQTVVVSCDRCKRRIHSPEYITVEVVTQQLNRPDSIGIPKGSADLCLPCWEKVARALKWKEYDANDQI